MRILHLTWIPRLSGYEGIVAKLDDLSSGAHRAGVPLDVRVLTHDAAAGGILQRIITPRGIPHAFVRLAKSAALRASLDFHPDDVVVLRYPGCMDVALPFLLEELRHRMISEHHTDELAELGDLRCGWARQALESSLMPAILGRMAGGIAMTQEIGDTCRRRGLRAPLLVLGNGVDVTRLVPSSRPDWHGGPLRVIMAAGVFWKWQGIDRVLRGILEHRGSPLELHLVGRLLDPYDLDLCAQLAAIRPGQVVLHGTLGQPALRQLFSQMHLALSTLALHRKQMTEACPIKSREYMAHGLPFVAAYDDPDIPPDAPGCLRMADHDGSIDPDEFLRFAHKCAMQPGLSSLMRQFAYAHLDYAAKADRMFRFIMQVTA